MGGTAVLIWGTADIERLSRVGFLARLFGRGTVSEAEIGKDRKLIELSPDSLRSIMPEFKSYIRRTVVNPWPATKSILDYLDIAFHIYARGEREGNAKPQWYVQLSFGGCAGMADISSEVAAHWATQWCEREWQQIDSILTPAGFSPTHLDDAHEELTYLPLGIIGYGAFRKMASAPEGAPPTYFEIDAAAIEGNEEHAETLLRALEADWVEFMSDGKCHCQFCDPTFDHTLLTQLPLDNS